MSSSESTLRCLAVWRCGKNKGVAIFSYTLFDFQFLSQHFCALIIEYQKVLHPEKLLVIACKLDIARESDAHMY